LVREKKRWPGALVIIAVVVIASAVMIYSFHDAPGGLPMSAISDGSNGVIVTWHDKDGIYTQRVDSSGQVVWQQGGVLVCDCPSISGFTLSPDGQGGAIVTWGDESVRPDDRDDPVFFDPIPFYAHRISASGKVLWSDLPVSTGKDWDVVADVDGGALIAWNEYSVYHKGLQDDYLRVQKIAPDGSRLWGEDGILVIASSQYRPLTEEEIARGVKGTITRSRPTYEGIHDIVSDGAGGTIVIWEEETEGGEHMVYARRFDAEGNTAWPERILAAYGSYYSGSATSDGSGGMFFAFNQSDTGATYRQHVHGDGGLLETGAYSPGSLNDGLGGFIQVRIDAEPTNIPPWEKHSLLFVRRFDGKERPVYPDKLVLSMPERRQIHDLDYAADGTGGIVLAWQTSKENVPYGGILAQRLDAKGNICWGEVGITVFPAPELNYQGGAVVIADGSGNVIIVAAAGRSAVNGDMVYAQRLDKDGNRLWDGGIRIDR
jgi:hypothetical protein